MDVQWAVGCALGGGVGLHHQALCYTFIVITKSG